MGDVVGDTVVGLLTQLQELPVLLKVAADLGRDVPPVQCRMCEWCGDYFYCT